MRTTSPRLGRSVQGTLHLLFQWMVFSLDFQINVCHFLTTCDYILAQPFSPPLFEPAVKQFS
jgi:hypothetical protein